MLATSNVAQRTPPRASGRMVPIDCPCCGHPVPAPPIDIIVDRYEITPMQRAILSAVWRGKGMPVSSERIFDAMYADDPDGGPARDKMGKAMKWHLFHLRQRLKGSGIGIENVGYHRGYRLVMGKRA